ncbi:hypothetical protein C8R47DRAFT_1205504 [Mycena vitilis]|nr:hypothetical protein C8R47DRAFT_1205504 [Mycena vitilis]
MLFVLSSVPPPRLSFGYSGALSRRRLASALQRRQIPLAPRLLRFPPPFDVDCSGADQPAVSAAAARRSRRPRYPFPPFSLGSQTSLHNLKTFQGLLPVALRTFQGYWPPSRPSAARCTRRFPPLASRRSLPPPTCISCPLLLVCISGATLQLCVVALWLMRAPCAAAVPVLPPAVSAARPLLPVAAAKHIVPVPSFVGGSVGTLDPSSQFVVPAASRHSRRLHRPAQCTPHPAVPAQCPSPADDLHFSVANKLASWPCVRCPRYRSAAFVPVCP